MAVHLHGFDWIIYSKRIMPAFEKWLTENDEDLVYQLFEQTHCMQEEAYLPEAMQRLRVWPRAQLFIDSLPRGPHSRREYQQLCSAEQFTELSDCYLHNHAPQLYQNSDAVRAVWGAIVEHYCLLWNANSTQLKNTPKLLETTRPEKRNPTTGPLSLEVNPIPKNDISDIPIAETVQDVAQLRSELVTLLQAAGLNDLLKELDRDTSVSLEQNLFSEESDPETTEFDDIDWSMTDPYTQEKFSEILLNGEDDGTEADVRPQGIIVGHHPNMLHMRGWLAGTSVRAMALFEFLACGRRVMPFGYEVNEPYGNYIGYLTPDEVSQLAVSLRDANPPLQARAEEDAIKYRLQQTEKSETFRLVDEVLPTYASEFIHAVRTAALQGIGLICNID